MADPKTITPPAPAAAAPEGPSVMMARPASEVAIKAAEQIKRTGRLVKVRALGTNVWYGDRVPLPDGRTVDTHKLYLETEVFMVDDSEMAFNNYDMVYETKYGGKYPGVYRRRGALQKVDPSTPLGVPPPAPKKASPFRQRR